MEFILGIDLGTTNSVVSAIRNGVPEVLLDQQGGKLLPSAVGVDVNGEVLVGQAARNQALLAPDRTILSVKRRMGEDVKLRLGNEELTPQEVSAIILRQLKQRAAERLGCEVCKAVITVPAFFSENQRVATREAGELAGLEVVRIINEPTAASLLYQPSENAGERLLVYDLGGGTFDVSIVQIESGVVEVLSSHGDTHLGGDDFDQLLLDFVCDRFQDTDKIDLRQIPTARSRLLQAVEAAKCRLSYEAYTTFEEPFLAEHKGSPVNFKMTIDRLDYEDLIEPLIQKTIHSVDAALEDANLHAQDIDQVVLVGGASRTPLVHRLLHEQLSKQPNAEIDPDLCVSLGAAMQGGLISGIDVDRVLVDITPRTLGVRCLGDLYGVRSDRCFSPLIQKNTPLPATRSELFYTAMRGQPAAQIDVYQGENEDAVLNDLVGSFTLEGLDENADENSEIVVRFELDLDGTLNVQAVERATSLTEQITIDNAVTRFRAANLDDAKRRIAAMVGEATPPLAESTGADDAMSESQLNSRQLLEKGRSLSGKIPSEDEAELAELLRQFEAAIDDDSEIRMTDVANQLEELLFYLDDA